MEHMLNMLRICVLVLVALGSIAVNGRRYERIRPTAFLAEGKDNRFITLRRESSDEGPVYWLDIKRTITSKSGLLLCEQWKYDTRGFGGVPCDEPPSGCPARPPVPPHGGIIFGPKCREFCAGLAYHNDRNPDFPGPDYQLSLRGYRCPLEKGSVRLPRIDIPEVVNIDLDLERDYIDVEVSIAEETCGRPEQLVNVTWVVFPCGPKLC